MLGGGGGGGGVQSLLLPVLEYLAAASLVTWTEFSRCLQGIENKKL